MCFDKIKLYLSLIINTRQCKYQKSLLEYNRTAVWYTGARVRREPACCTGSGTDCANSKLRVKQLVALHTYSLAGFVNISL